MPDFFKHQAPGTWLFQASWSRFSNGRYNSRYLSKNFTLWTACWWPLSVDNCALLAAPLCWRLLSVNGLSLLMTALYLQPLSVNGRYLLTVALCCWPLSVNGHYMLTVALCWQPLSVDIHTLLAAPLCWRPCYIYSRSLLMVAIYWRSLSVDDRCLLMVTICWRLLSVDGHSLLMVTLFGSQCCIDCWYFNCLNYRYYYIISMYKLSVLKNNFSRIQDTFDVHAWLEFNRITYIFWFWKCKEHLQNSNYISPSNLT